MMSGVLEKNNPSRRREPLLLCVLAGVVFLSRIPFLSPGAGNDPDAWRIVNTAREIAVTGTYSASRLPGFPVPEFAYSFLRTNSPLILNGITALLSSIGFFFFVLSLKKINGRNNYLAALAMAFTPAVYVNSTTSMDYIWALAFILVSFYYILDEKPLAAGLLLGLAAGCRITSTMFILPFSVIFYYAAGNAMKRIFLFSAAAVVAGVAMFIPVINKYGLNFFPHDDMPYPDIIVIAGRSSVGIWGISGLTVIVLFLVVRLMQKQKVDVGQALSMNKGVVAGSLLAIGLHIILFLRFPYESGYLIPVVPFVILLTGNISPKKHFVIVCIMLIVSPFLCSLEMGGMHFAGPLIRDHERRAEKHEFIRNAIVYGKELPEESVIVSGPNLPQIQTYLSDHPSEVKKYVYLLNEAELQSRLNDGCKIFYLPGMNSYNLEIYGVDIGAVGKPILIP